MHHFTHQPHLSTQWQDSNTLQSNPASEWADKQSFRCTSQYCACEISIMITSPRLTSHWVAQLTDRHVIRTRAEQAMAKDPQKFEGIAIPSPVNVLEYLILYIKDSLFNPSLDRKIKVDNKHFATKFGETCSDLLLYVGFTTDDSFWYPPRPVSKQEAPFTDAPRTLLDDVREELIVLISKEPADQLRSTKVIIQPSPALTAIGDVLHCRRYRTNPPPAGADPSADEHPFYAGLGVLADFHDDLVVFAYKAQIDCDPQNIAYYLECLQTIAAGRHSEDLQIQADIEQMRGHISLKDIRAAYANLGLNARDTQLSEDIIIGTFQARIADAPKQEGPMRHDLKIIGQDRGSKRIELVASQGKTA